MGYTLYYNPSSNEIIPEMDYNKSLVSTNDVSVVYKDDLKLIEKGFIPVRPGLRNGILHRWRWGIETFQERIHEIKMFPNGNGFTPKFKQTGLNPPKNICNFTGGANDLKHLFGKSLFSYPKSISFIRYLVSIGCNKDSVVLDFFSGSATTAHAVMQINAEDGGQRKFIMVQLPALCDEKSEAFKAGYKNICEIGKERIRRAGKQINEELIQNGKTLVDVGFKVLKLDSSNIITWDDSLTNNINDLKERLSKQILNLKGDRTETDLIYEILLKMGFGLTTKINLENINNKTVCSVKENGVNMLICLDQGIVPEDIEQMAELEPNAVVISEGSFVDNSTLSNALYIFKNHDIELKLI